MRERVIRGTHCLAIGAFCSIVSLVLQIAIHVSQASVHAGSSIAMVKLNLESLKQDMRVVFGNSSIGDDLYNTTQGAPLGQSLGLRHEYRWGLYGHCAYILTPESSGVCGNHTFAASWTPFETLRADIPPQYFVQVNEFIIEPIRRSPTLGTVSHVAFYLIFLATLATILVIPLGIIRTTLTFLIAAVLSITSALALLIAAAMWTSIVSLVQATNRTRTGIVADFGQGIWLTWAAFAFSLTSVLPYVISSRTFRRY
ncbi:hypothetical protein CPB86DRAFT_759578 [Serendipita vermifera]|nr:hypothetical protein CPB86DRAFT_759578 [Serendipita vermifera]